MGTQGRPRHSGNERDVKGRWSKAWPLAIPRANAQASPKDPSTESFTYRAPLPRPMVGSMRSRSGAESCRPRAPGRQRGDRGACCHTPYSIAIPSQDSAICSEASSNSSGLRLNTRIFPMRRGDGVAGCPSDDPRPVCGLANTIHPMGTVNDFSGTFGSEAKSLVRTLVEKCWNTGPKRATPSN